MNTETQITSPADETSPAIERPQGSTDSQKPQYDAAASQTVVFEGLGELEIEVDVDPITDEIYRKTVEPMNRTYFNRDGSLVPNELYKGMAALFDAVVTDLRGIPGERPENWKEQLDAIQIKSPVMSRFLTVACYNDAPAWGQTDEVILTDAYFGEDVVTGRHFLRKKTAEDVRRFNALLKAPPVKGQKTLKSDMISVPNMSAEKARFYDSLATKPAEGYAGGVVPIWHKVAVVEHLFTSGVTAKK